MNVQIFKKISSNISEWKTLFNSFDIGIQEIKIIKYFGEILSISKPTGFVLKKNDNHFAVGYTTKKCIFFDTKIFNPENRPYENNKASINLHNFHLCLYHRLELLTKLDLSKLPGLKYFELSRKCTLATFVQCGLDIDILYKRELVLLKKIETCSFDYFKSLKKERNLQKVMYELYHTNIPQLNEPFLDVYMLDVMKITYKWSDP